MRRPALYKTARIFFYILLFSSAVSCGSSGKTESANSNSESAEPKQLTIAAAASTQFAVREIAKVFESKHDVKVNVIIGSSGKLTTQIINGAPYDIFFSANMKYPNVLVEKQKAVPPVAVFGYGVPALWTMDNSIPLDTNGTCLLQTNIEKIAIAEPKNAPYGEMAINFFKHKSIDEIINEKLVFGESISQVNEYVINQVAQIGITSKSILVSPKVVGKGQFVTLGKRYWVPQGVVELNNNGKSETKTKLVQFILSKEGVQILKKYGYEL